MTSRMSGLKQLTSSDPRVSVGVCTYGQPEFLLWGENERISIGKFCSIAARTVIFGGGEHRWDWVTTFPMRVAFGLDGAWVDGIPTTKGPTSIGNDVWIGYGTTVLSGVQVGDGAVIGAMSVVASDVPPYAIVTGNPAKVIRHRFENHVIENLLRIRWWDWPLERIVKFGPLLSSPDMEKFIALASQQGPREA